MVGNRSGGSDARPPADVWYVSLRECVSARSLACLPAWLPACRAVLGSGVLSRLVVSYGGALLLVW